MTRDFRPRRLFPNREPSVWGKGVAMEGSRAAVVPSAGHRSKEGGVLRRLFNMDSLKFTLIKELDRIKRKGAQAVLVVFGVLLSLVVLEFAARWLEAVKRAGWYSPMDWDRWHVETLRFSSLLGYEAVPGHKGFNSLGFLNPEYAIQKPKDVFRIVLIGDSLAQLYGSFLSDELTASFPSSRFEVWNMGLSGYNLNQEAKRLIHQGVRYGPDLVVFFFCLNDLDANSDIPVIFKTETGIFEIKGRGGGHVISPLHPILQKSALYRAGLVFYIKKMAPRLFFPKHTKIQWAEEVFGRIRAVLDREGLPAVAFLFPYLKNRSEYTPEELQDYRILRDLLKKYSIPHYDLHGAIEESRIRSLRFMPDDDLHHSREGATLLMKKVAAFLGECCLQRTAGGGGIERAAS